MGGADADDESEQEGLMMLLEGSQRYWRAHNAAADESE